MPMPNPWAHSRTEREGTAPDVAVQQTSAYAAPSLSAGDAYTDTFGWAPTLAPRTSTVETPSAQRLQTIPVYQRYPNGVRPPEEFYDRMDRDEETRESVTSQNAIGWTIPAGINTSDRRWADNPRRTPPPESRPTSRLGQNTQFFVRPFDQLNRQYDGEPPVGSARQLNGVHFSMADHRRNYEILGMRPVQERRNTYRLEPGPWDQSIVDMPPEEPTVNYQIRSYDLPSPSRSLRLM